MERLLDCLCEHGDDVGIVELLLESVNYVHDNLRVVCDERLSHDGTCLSIVRGALLVKSKDLAAVIFGLTMA